ncbi:Ig-like domain-containing protein [Mariniphaga sediminis]|uniref:Ig-like domain-containing protein n=1 Tax=Mariniphaga sediminis TaxID=1628158 RepID=UPI003566A542
MEEVTGYNDCLWNVITPNLQRFISQIDPNETSAGYYRVGLTETPTSWIGEPYGRYARGFDVANGKNTMYFDVDDQYFASNRNKGNGKLKVKIIYYANDGGSWELKYHAADGTIKTACSVSNEVGKNWRTKEVTIEDALLDNGGPKGADLILQNTGGTNCRFHMIELERDLISLENTNQYPYQGMQRNIPGFIEGEFYDEGGEGFAYHADTLKEGTGNFRPEDNVDILSRDSASNGYCVGFTGNGEWLEYTLDVTSGLYNISLHYFCSEPVGELILSLDGTVLTTISGLSSNGGETPLTFEVEKVPITGGQKKTLKLEFSGGSGFELDGIEFSLIKIPVSGISISQCPSGKLNVSHSHQMYANVYPVEASNKTVRWSTSDASVATVDSMGLLRAVSTGFVTISASTTEADYSATCEINVGPLLVTEVIIEKCPNMLYEGSTEQLTAIIKPAGVDNASLTWNSSDNNVLAVNESGLIRAIKEGSATVSLTTTDGKFISSCEIVVRKPEITLSGISITNCPAEKLKIDETLQLNVKFLPEGIEDQPLSWRATDTTIVKVDESGLVSTLSDGTSLVIATCKGYTRYCVVHVASALTNAPDKVVQLNKDVKVYPNPANKNCYIDFSNIDNEKCVNIYNENGQLLYTETTFDKALELNLDNFANQTLLFVQVILSKNTVVNKIVRILR